MAKEYSTIDYINISINMKRYGGSFVHALSVCIDKADLINKRKLVKAFPEYFQKYNQWK